MRERRGPFASRIWRVLRRMLPREWRERHGRDVLQIHVALAGGEQGAGGLGFWLRVARDVVLTAVQVRLDGLRGSDRDGPRESRRAGRTDAVLQSFRLAFRALRRTPAFAVAVVAIFALGIAANVTMFRVLDRVLLSPPSHIAAPEEVRRVHVLGRSVFSGEVGYNESLAYPDYRQLLTVDAVPRAAGYGGREFTLVEEGRAERVRAAMVTASFFPLLGVSPAAGRFFTEDEDRLGEAGVVVLGHSFWQRRFGGVGDVIGRTLTIGRASYTVVGVAPRHFTGVDIEPVEVWLPLHPASEAESGTQWVDAFGWYMMGGIVRVAPERVAAAEEAATRAYRAARADRRGFDPDSRVVLSPLIAARGPNASQESQVARLLGLLTILVLLVTCANVGNLFLARVLSRRRELAVQAALGVSRRRLFGQLLAEVWVLALVAAAAALWISSIAGGALFRVLLPDAAPPDALGVRVVLATLAIALVTAMLTGVLPALRATRADVMDTLRQAKATASARGARRALLMAQAALSVVLLVGAGLFIRSLQTAETMDIGLDRATLAVSIELEDGESFGDDLSAAVRQAVPAIRANAEVESAAATSLTPFSGWWGVSIAMPGRDTVNTGPNGPYAFAVTGDYFETLGLAIVRGRAITDADDVPGAAPVAVVNESLARTLWPDQDALGQCIMLRDTADGGCTTVVGVAGDVIHRLTDDQAPQIFYVPTTNTALGDANANQLVVRARPGASADRIRQIVLSEIPQARFASVASLEERIAPQLRSWRLGASLLTAFGALALLIAAAGLYSTLAFDVTQRRRELGVRAALGAPARRLVSSIVAGNLLTVSVGVAVGLLVALLAGRAAEAMLFRVRSTDPLVFAGVAGTLLFAAAIAAVLPAWAATRVDPAITLRED